VVRRTLVLALALTAAVPGSAPAALAAQDAASVVMRIGRISPFVDESNPLEIVAQVFNGGDDDARDVTMQVTLYPPVLSRSQLRETIDAGTARAPIHTAGQARPDPLPPGERAILSVRLTRTDLAGLTGTGVYPVAITISVNGIATTYRTAVPYMGSAPETRLNLTWLMPVGRDNALQPGGAYSEELLEAMRLDELRQQMDAVAARPGLPVTLLPAGSFIDSLADLADGFALQAAGGALTGVDPQHPLAAAAGRSLESLAAAAGVVGEVGSAAYTPADLAALSAHGLGSDVVRQIGAGRRAVEQHLRRTPSFRFLAPPGFRLGPLEASTLATLGVEGVVVDPATLPAPPPTPEDHPGLRYDLFGVSRPVLLRAGTERLGSLLIDADLRARLQQEDQGVLLAQTLIAETASAWLEVPLFAEDRLLVLASSSIPKPAALTAALDGLAAAPWLQMRTATDALAILPPRAPAMDVEQVVPPDAANLARARQARASLELLDSISIEPHPRAPELERMVLLAESGEWEAEPERGAALAGTAVRTVDRIVTGIGIAPRPVTLTSRTGRLPVTLTNATGFPVRVRVRLDSTKATFPGGDTRTVELLGRHKTEDFEVEALATGSFPITVLVETPDGRTLASRSVVLRSTAVSAVALAAVGGGALFLILGSLRRGRKRRRNSAPRAG